MKLHVDRSQRLAKMRAHTATHLVHFFLQKIFPQTKQAGSLVNADYVRFDYTADRLLDDNEIQQLQEQINTVISQSLPVEVSTQSFDEATAGGAKAFFQDKYGDTVRVVRIAMDSDQQSVELCGGTHVASTHEIGACVIIGQETVASGTKRIIALTGPRVVSHVDDLHSQLQGFAQDLDIPLAQLPKKRSKILKEHQEFQETITSLQTKLLSSELTSIAQPSSGPWDTLLVVPDSLLSLGFKTIVQEAKTLFGEQKVLVRSSEGQFALLSGDTGFDVKAWASEQGLRGGGSSSLFQGKDPQILEHS